MTVTSKGCAKKVGEVDKEFVAVIPQESGAREKIKVAYVVLSRGQRKDKLMACRFLPCKHEGRSGKIARRGIEVSQRDQGNLSLIASSDSRVTETIC